MKLTVVLSPASDRGYTVVCPALPGAVTEGDTLDEALQNMKEAAESWLMAWLEDGHALPEETPAMIQAEIDQCISDREEEGLPPLIETSEIEVADPEVLAQRAILDEEALLDYARDEGLIDDDDERTLKPCTVRAIIRHTGLSMEEFLDLLDGDDE